MKSRSGKPRTASVKFLTLGCKVNQYETQAIREQLCAAGLSEVNGRQISDIYVINTCTVTHLADRQARQLIRRALKENPGAKIFVTGCYVEKDALQIAEISERIRIIPNSQKHRIADLLGFTHDACLSGRQARRLPVRQAGTTHDETFVPLSISGFKGHTRAFVKIQDGCDNFCAYCKVPLVRGRSRSRRCEEIKSEIKRLMENNFKEIVLCGICLGDYNHAGYRLADLIADLEKLNYAFRLRLSSIEPDFINPELVTVMKSAKKFCPHLHLPLQSGDDKILNRMRRRYSVQEYLALAAELNKNINDFALTTDVLVGFPGETDKNFRNTLEALKKITPLRTHIFRFSRRGGTLADDFKDNIDASAVRQRMREAADLAGEVSFLFRRQYLGRVLNVLIERNAGNGKVFCGYSENYIRVLLPRENGDSANRIIPVRITEVSPGGTNGESAV